MFYKRLYLFKTGMALKEPEELQNVQGLSWIKYIFWGLPESEEPETVLAINSRDGFEYIDSVLKLFCFYWKLCVRIKNCDLVKITFSDMRRKSKETETSF